MTDLKQGSTHDRSTADRARRLKLLGIVAVLGVAVAAFGAWYFIIRDTSAAAVDSEAAAAEREEALAEAQAEADPPAPDDETEEPEVEAVGLDGTWTVDTSIGTFDEGCLTDACGAPFLGFRINEELASIGAKTVVGRTPGVSGTMELEGTTITATNIIADMTGLITDSGRRTNSIRSQAIETNAFPEASFVLTQPIELGAIPGDGEEILIDATGDFTIHGVTRTETLPLTAQISGDTIVIFGQLGPILLADYNIDKPTAATVLSVEDNAIMELQLFLTR